MGRTTKPAANQQGLEGKMQSGRLGTIHTKGRSVIIVVKITTSPPFAIRKREMKLRKRRRGKTTVLGKAKATPGG